MIEEFQVTPFGYYCSCCFCGWKSYKLTEDHYSVYRFIYSPNPL